MQEFPVIERGQLMDLAKAGKRRDLERILHSRASEDWVTWNVFRLLFRQNRSGWWNHLLGVARRRNPHYPLTQYAEQPAETRFWETIAAPRDYEAASRKRMTESGIPVWIARSQVRKPVEGPSEIDLLPWRDIAEPVLYPSESDDDETAAVKQELRRRIP